MAHSSIADLRKDYALHSLSEKDVATNPFVQFSAWWKQATEADIEEVNAMTLATSDGMGNPGQTGDCGYIEPIVPISA